MKKLSLRLEELSVESFETSLAATARGTVAGNASGEALPCTGEVCTPAGTYGGNTCETTCNQDLCDCTYGGPYNTTCDINLTCGQYGSCQYQTCAGPQDHTYCSG